MYTKSTKPIEASAEVAVPAQQEQSARTGLKGTALSNTVPSTCINKPRTKILRTGVDSLYVSFPGELSQASSHLLDKLKAYAQSSDPETASLAQIQLGSHLFEVKDRGRSVYAYVLKNNCFEIAVSKLGADNLPLAYIKIYSELLTLRPLNTIIDDLLETLEPLGSLEGFVNLSRLDLCADFVTDFDWSAVADSDWVTRAKGISRHSVSKRFSGFSIGTGGKLSARLYDKTLEMEGKPRPYLGFIWGEAGWDAEQYVWRLEFQYQRDVLKELNVPTYDELPSNLAGLWNYASNAWLRLAIPSETDKTQTRWPTAEVWQVLQAASWAGSPDYSRIEIEKRRLPSDKWLFENGLSAYTSFMAREGFAKADDGMRAYYLAAKAHHDARENYTGNDFQGYVLEKVKTKQKLFNTAMNVRNEKTVLEVHQSAAETYRRQRDGE